MAGAASQKKKKRLVLDQLSFHHHSLLGSPPYFDIWSLLTTTLSQLLTCPAMMRWDNYAAPSPGCWSIGNMGDRTRSCNEASLIVTNKNPWSTWAQFNRKSNMKVKFNQTFWWFNPPMMTNAPMQVNRFESVQWKHNNTLRRSHWLLIFSPCTLLLFLHSHYMYHNAFANNCFIPRSANMVASHNQGLKRPLNLPCQQ